MIRVMAKYTCNGYIVGFQIIDGNDILDMNLDEMRSCIVSGKTTALKVNKQTGAIESDSTKLSTLKAIKVDITKDGNILKHINLWHGTYGDTSEKILNKGKIECNKLSSGNVTSEVDKALGGIRKNCIYLSKNRDSEYECAFKINTRKLDLSKLYVGANSVANNIVRCLACNEDAREYISEYKKSFIKYEEYCKYMYRYDNMYFPEFMYFGDIKVNKRNLD